jgi:hypothetical protein
MTPVYQFVDIYYMNYDSCNRYLTERCDVETLPLALANLTSIPVLVFVAAVIAARLKTDIRLPDAVYQGITIFLLVGIGIKGGHALKETSGGELILPGLTALGLGIVLPFLAFGLLSLSKKVTRIEKGSLAAHYGSTSLVTFTAGLVMLESLKIFVEPYTAALLAIMEIPGIIVGIYLGTRGPRKGTDAVPIGVTLKEVLLGKTVLLLVVGLAVGFVAPESSFIKVEPFFVALQPGVLVLFLLQLGFIVGSKLGSVLTSGVWLPVFAILMPLASGTIGALVGTAAGMSVGGATMLAILCASASYIAAPAAVGLAMPTANLSLALTASLGITFPFNLIVGLPLYLGVARFAEHL